MSAATPPSLGPNQIGIRILVAKPPSLSEIRRALGARKGWGLLHTYGRLTVLEQRDGAEQWIACVYASRTGDQGAAHECVAGVGATPVAALEDLAARAAIGGEP